MLCTLTSKLSIYFSSLVLKRTDLRSKPKHIVFLSNLPLPFKFCHVCKADNPLVVANGVGTEAVVKTTCTKCKKENMWHSQPTMPESSTPVGNFSPCMAILLAGGLASKVLQIFSHTGLGCVSLNTFFKSQRVSIPISSYNFQMWVFDMTIR